MHASSSSYDMEAPDAATFYTENTYIENTYIEDTGAAAAAAGIYIENTYIDREHIYRGHSGSRRYLAGQRANPDKETKPQALN